MKVIVSIIAGIVVILLVGGLIFLFRPDFGRLPRGERLEKIKKSPNYKNGQFQNLHPTVLMTSDKGRLRAIWDFLFASKKGLYPETPIVAIKTDLKKMPSTVPRMVWFGHSSYLLQLAGKHILVDPVFYQAAPVSFINKSYPGTDIYKPDDMPDIDLLVITHDHWDHLDYRTVVELKDRIIKVVCPLGVGEHFEYWGFDKNSIVELDWQEQAVPLPGVTVHCLPARHFSGRGLISNHTLWASFLLETPSGKVYIGGDSGYDTHYEEIGKQYPDIDLAILENGQYNEEWRYIHMMPFYLGHAARDLNARNIITVHHSKYALARHDWDEPLKNELQAAEEFSFHLIVPQIGQEIGVD